MVNMACRTIPMGDQLKSESEMARTRATNSRMSWQIPGVFCGDDGKPLSRFPVRWAFRKILKAAGLPELRFHDLRHTSATLLLQAGVHPKIVQERLGHAKIDVTLDVYSHVMPGMQREAANHLDGLLTGKCYTRATFPGSEATGN